MTTPHLPRTGFSMHALLATCMGLTGLMTFPPNARTQADIPVDSTALLQARLVRRLQDVHRLENMLSAMNQVDSVYKVRYPTWVILDEDLKERIYHTFLMRNESVQRGSDVVVVTNPETREIVELTVGDRRMGRMETRQNLSDSLMHEILDMEYQRRILEITPVRPRYNVLTARPRYAALTASAFGAAIILRDNLGLEVRLGQEEIGYHFWSTGDMRVRILLDQLKIGVLVPFSFGVTGDPPPGPDPLGLKRRFMAGSTGVSGELELPINDDLVGFRATVGETKFNTIGGFSENPLDSYSLHSVLQAYYSHQVQFGQDEHLLTLMGGVGYHQIVENALRDATVQLLSKTNFVSPLFRVEYVHQGGRLYGMTVQYYSAILFASCWFELVKNFLFVDMKYYTPVGRDPKPWEQPYFFMISPRFQIVY